MGRRYRLLASLGVIGITGLVVLVANLYPVQRLFTTYVPLFWRLDPTVLHGTDLLLATALTVWAVAIVLLPLYKPRPMRGLDAIFRSQRRVIVAGLGLATLGYFNYSYRLPRTTLALIVSMLVIVIPVWFVWIRERPRGSERAVLVGDDPQQFVEIASESDLSFVGQICPAMLPDDLPNRRILSDGGVPFNRLGGLPRTDEILVGRDIETAVLAFREPDRGDFFGTLDTCYQHGIDVKVHRGRADSVLTSDHGGDVLVDVDIEPWDMQDYMLKRGFDFVFALTGLLVLAPVIALIAAAIKLDDGGSILYAQERTSGFGESITIYKFRTMVEGAENRTGPTISAEDAGGRDPRVTRVGRVLRPAHLDEIPQLATILTGRMSVVGPRPERPELEPDFEHDVDWKKRWFVKPGLTGLAQIHGVTGQEPERKLQYDLAYIRRQSFTFDMKIVIRQVWTVIQDLAGGPRR